MARDSSGSHNEPVYLGSGAPATAADLNEVVAFAKATGNTKSGTAADRAALTGADVWDGLLFTETDTGRVALRLSGAWIVISSGADSVHLSGFINLSSASTSPATGSFTLPVAFADTSYNVVFGVYIGTGGQIIYVMPLSSSTTTTVNYRYVATTTISSGTYPVQWHAIGRMA